MRMFYRILLLSLFVFSNSGVGRELKYSSEDIFPVHDEMVDACQFWIQIFGEYNTNQYLIHDSRKLDIIYEVVTWGELDENKADDPFTKEQKEFFKKKTKHYEDILSGIAAVYPDTNKMDQAQKTVFRQLSGFKSKNDFLEARQNIRVQRGQKNKFKRGLEISGRYMPFLKATFQKYNLPEELIVLPHVESSFNYKAYSSVGAAGIWQFTRGTGKQFLKITYELDERLDPILATEAAAKLLKRNYEVLGSWPLAITAYNHGAHGMKRAVKKLNTSDLNTIIKNYRSRYFKFASRNFYCEFIAALYVVQNYMAYFGPINLFRKYNPGLRHSVYDNSKYIPKGYRLRLPMHLSPDSLLTAILESAYYAEQKQSKYYRIGYGDNLSNIARRFGTSVEMLMALNNISNAHFIRRGMTIRLPDKTDTPVLLALKENDKISSDLPIQVQTSVETESSVLTLQPASDENYQIELDSPIVVQPTDSFITMAFWLPEIPEEDTVSTAVPLVQTNGKTLADLEMNIVKKDNLVYGYIQVEPEETLGHYSEWLQTRTQNIRDWNDLSYSSTIHLNQRIKLVFEKVSPDEFNRVRLEYHRGLEEDFFVNYVITDTLTHKEKNGENLWYLCNYVYNLPYWLVVDFNKDIDLNKLKTGDKIVIPAVKSKG